MSSLQIRDAIKGSIAIGKGEQGIQGIQGEKGDNNVCVGLEPTNEAEIWFDTTDSDNTSELATKEYVDNEISKIDLSGNVNLSDYATKNDLLRKADKTDLDNIANRVTTLETNGGGSGGGNNLNLRDVVAGEIFELNDTPDMPSEPDIPSEPVIAYGEIILNKNSLSITEGKTDTFTVKLDKAPTNNQVVTLNKSNSDVVLSSYSLTFTPSNYSTVQTVTITVVEDNTDYSNETCTISISSPNVSTKTLIVNITDNDEEPPANVPVSSVSLDISSHTLEVGQTIQLTPTVLPNNATNKSVTWSANNSNCTVDNGLIEAINSGSCVITCTTVDGNKTATCDITIPVVEPDEPDTPEGLTLINYIYNSDTYTNPTDISQHPIPDGNKNIYWQAYKATKTVSDGIATLLFNGNGFFQCRPSTGDGKTYYFSYLVDTASSSYVNCQISSTSAKYVKDLGNGWTLYASVSVDSNANFNSKIEDKRTSDWTPIQTKEWMKICLTDLYPDGNFPSVEECSNLFEYVSGIKG